jgi:hypothetical protein
MQNMHTMGRRTFKEKLTPTAIRGEKHQKHLSHSVVIAHTTFRRGLPATTENSFKNTATMLNVGESLFLHGITSLAAGKTFRRTEEAF